MWSTRACRCTGGHPAGRQWKLWWVGARHSMSQNIKIHTSVFFIGLFFFVWLTQEAYSVARQFNLIPPVCEQAEYHFFQRDKVETQLPELYHKIGESSQTFPASVNVGYFVNAMLYPPRCWCGLLVSVSLWNHHWEVWEWCPRIFQGLNEGAGLICFKRVTFFLLSQDSFKLLKKSPLWHCPFFPSFSHISG